MMLGGELTPWQTLLRATNEMQREMNKLFSRFFGESEQVGNQWLSPSERFVHDLLIGLYMNHVEFGRTI